MHFVFATRGIYASIQQMISDLTAQRFPWRRIDKTPGSPTEGKIVDTYVQGILRPIQLWEYVFPEKSPEKVGDANCRMIDNLSLVLRGFDISNAQHYPTFGSSWAVDFLRSKIGLKKIPDVDLNKGEKLMIHQQGIATYPIGIKEDEYGVKSFPNGMGGQVTFKQEMI